MGYQQDGYAMGARFYTDDASVGSWLTGDLVDRVFLAPLADAGLLDHCCYVSRDFQPPTRASSPAALRTESSAWRYELVDLSSEEDTSNPDCEVILNLATSSVDASIRLGGEVLERFLDRLVPLCIGWVAHWTRALPAGVELHEGGLSPWSRPYPRPHPPRTSTWQLDSVCHCFGQRRLRRSPEGSSLLAGLLTSPLPPAATRSLDGDVLVLAFERNLRDAGAVARARTAHEQWISQIVPTEPERGWNAEGDRLVIPGDLTPHAPLTLYDATARVGYKAIVVQPDGSVDQEIWEDMQRIAAQKRLPDGTRIDAVRLIVPVRENALAIHDRAMANGFEMVTYPAGSARVFWQVHPDRPPGTALP
jgi:hypothetical protein